jgi:DNA-binding Lrp family transcriptional regulator
MGGTSGPGPDRAILDDLVVSGFPVDRNPYCVIAGRVGLSEGDVLERILGMRMDGSIVRIGATFSGERCSVLSDDDLELVDLLGGDLPTSEAPYAELAAELELRGVDADEDWVLGRAASWLGSGVITAMGVELATGAKA